MQVKIDDLENSFMFNTGFQSSSAIAKQMEYAVGTLSIYPEFLADLRKELDGKVSFELQYDIKLRVRSLCSHVTLISRTHLSHDQVMCYFPNSHPHETHLLLLILLLLLRSTCFVLCVFL